LSDFTDNLLIDTPENVVLDAEIAGFGSRCVAALVDYTVLILVACLVSYLYINAAASRDLFRNPFAVIGPLALIQFVIVTFYHLFFELAWNGQTPGKRIVGIRVVQSTGLPVTVSGAIIRNLVRIFDFFPLLYAVGLVVLFATKNTQRLGDLAAKTVVIRERKSITLENVQDNFTVHYRYISRLTPIPHYIDIRNLNEQDRRTIVNYLQRRDEIRNRGYVAEMLARQIAERIGANGAVRLPNDADVFLEQVARAFEIKPIEAKDEDDYPPIFS
jgi:uncharacterized RDD family membrane protein YckC